MMICDECKRGELDVTTHHIMITGLSFREPVAALDLCKGCKQIFTKKIQDLVRQVVRRKR